MAEAQRDSCTVVSSCSSSTDPQETNKHVEDQEGPVSSAPECAVCLQPCIHPARLPCNHVFCYLCVKGVANQSKRCPMCRQEIPPDFLERPELVELGQAQQKDSTSADSHEEYQWFYEGRNGWWQYDQRTSLELETAYKQGKRSCELLIAGFLYVADFSSMLQTRRNDHSRKRRIKRDLYNAPKKGIAGLRFNNLPVSEQEEQQQREYNVREIRGAERHTNLASDNIGDGITVPIPPSNTPQTPAGGPTSGDATPSSATRLLDQQRSDSLHQVLEHMRSLILRENLTSNNQQDLQETINDGSFSDQSLLSWLHQTSANTVYSSDEEHA